MWQCSDRALRVSFGDVHNFSPSDNLDFRPVCGLSFETFGWG